jgi:peptide/nickel transport system permease protein
VSTPQVLEGAVPLETEVEEPILTRHSAWRIILRNKLAVAGGIVVLIWVIACVGATWFAPYDPVNISPLDILQRLSAPSWSHLMGVDADGRDIFSRVLYGGRYSLGIGFTVVAAGTDIVLAFPIIILAIAIAAALGPSPVNTAIAMIAVWWPSYARVVRSLVLQIRERDFVLAARALGMRDIRILMRTILPNTIGPVIVLLTLDIGNAILTIAGLSFIGFGVPQPTPEWGNMISYAQNNPDQWWESFFPGLAIFTCIMGFNFFGDAVRDALDPRTR